MREPVAVDVLVRVDDAVPLGQELRPRFRLLHRTQLEERLALQRHLGHDPERAEPDSSRVEDLGLLGRGAADHLAGAGDQLEADDGGGDGPVAQPGAVGPGRGGAGNGLAIDVPEVGQRQIAATQLLVQPPERDAGLDGGGHRLAVDGDEPVERADPQHPAVGAGNVRERVAGGDDLDRLAGPGGRFHRLDDLEQALRLVDRDRGAVLVSAPVPPPAGPVGPDHR